MSPTPVAGTLGSRGLVAFPGFSLFLLPWSGSKANTNWSTRTQSSADLGGGSLDTNSSAQNNSVTWDEWLDGGTYKVAMLYGTGLSYGIHNITGINGTQTIDSYAALGVDAYAEVTGVTVTAGLKTIVDTMATKNVLSTNYFGQLHSLSFIRTGA